MISVDSAGVATDLENRFRHHPPSGPATIAAHEAVRSECLQLAMKLQALIPAGREKSLAITGLETVMFWANAAIARAQGS